MCEVMREMCIGADDGLSQASMVHRHGVVVELLGLRRPSIVYLPWGAVD